MMIQILLLILVSCICLFLNRLKFHRFINVANIFTLAWTVTLLLNYFYSQNNNLIKPGQKVFSCVIVGIITFNFIYFIFSKKNHSVIFDMNKVYVNKSVFKCLYFGGIILMLPNFIKSLTALFTSGFSFSFVRSQYLNLVSSGQGIYVYITNIIPNAIFIAAIMLSILQVLDKNYNYIWYILGAIVMSVISFGGRTIIFEFILEYCIAYFLFRNNKRIKLNFKIIVPVIMVIIAITFSRGIISTFSNTFATYFYQQYSFLQYIFDHEGMFEIQNGASIHYGTITFSFLVAPIYLLLSIFNKDISLPSYYVDMHSQIFYNISTSGYQLINNNTTSIYHFFLDYGNFYFLGFIAMALVLCVMERFASKSMSPRKYTIYVCIYVILLKNILYSPVYYGLYSISFSFVFFFLWLMSTDYRITIKTRRI